MIDRRAFLKRLGFGTVAACAAANSLIDIERLLWTPEKTIFLPPVATPILAPQFCIGDVITFDNFFAVNPRNRRKQLRQFVVTGSMEPDDKIIQITLEPAGILAQRVGNAQRKGTTVITRGWS